MVYRRKNKKLRADNEATRRALEENITRVIALEDNFESLYDVELETGIYEIYTKNETYSETINAYLINENDFFSDITENVKRVVYPIDRDDLIRVLSREHICETLKNKDHIDWYYRLMIDGSPEWFRLRIVYKNSDKRNIILGVFNAAEEIEAKKKEERLRTEVLNRMLGDDGLFLVDYVNNKRETVHNRLQGAEYFDDNEGHFEALDRYIDTYVAESDRDMVREATAIDYMVERLKSEPEYSINYRDITAGIQRFYELKIATFSDREVLLSFRESDAETVDKLMLDRLEDDFFALFGVDLDTALLRIKKKSPWYDMGEVGQIVPLIPAMRRFADYFEDETRDFFLQRSNIDFLKDRFKKEDKATYTYKSTLMDETRWICVTEMVLTRLKDGTPSLMAVGFGFLDEESSRREDLKIRLKEQLEIIGGVATEYTALFHVNLDTGIYKNYVATNRIPDTKDKLGRFNCFIDLYNDWVDSEAVHPDFKQPLRDMYPDDESIREKLYDRKKLSILFLRKYAEGYLWTEMSIVKCEDTKEEAHSIVVGFVEKDDEIRREMESAKRKKEAEESQKFIDNITTEYDVVFIVNMDDDSAEIRRMDDELIARADYFTSFTEARDYILENVIHPRDRERMSVEFDFDTIRQKFRQSPSYDIEYSIIRDGATLWQRVNLTALGGDRMVMGMGDYDLEIVKRYLEDKRYGEYRALAIVDVDTGMVREVKRSPQYHSRIESGITLYSPWMREYAEMLAGEARTFFMQLSDMEYIKREMATEDKHTYSYKSEVNNLWLDMTSYVIMRHEDGSPAVFTLGFSYADSFGAERQELQSRLKEDMQMIGGLASGYHTLYYINIEDKTFKIYSLDGEKFPEAGNYVHSDGDPLVMLKQFGTSELIHPDDRWLFEDINYANVREKLAHTKKYTIRFRRKYDEFYLWMEMDIVKYEGVDEQANAVAVGFALRDSEIRREQALERSMNVLRKEKSPAESIDELISLAGEYYGAERSYVFEYVRHKEYIDNTYTWYAPTAKTKYERLQNISAAELAAWMSEFEHHGEFCMESLEDVHNTEGCVRILRMQNVEKLAAVPIMKGEEIVGFIAVINPTKSENDLSVLKTTAIVVYSEILKRKEDDEEHVTLSKLTDTFISVYYADLSRDYLHTWKIDEDYKNSYGDVKYYSESMGGYVRNCIAERDRERCIEMTSPAYIRKQFASRDRFSIDMTDIMLGRERDFVFDYVKVDENGNQMVICCRDVTATLANEREQQRQLEDALSMAESASRAKTTFLNSMSHDIRTPMNAIIGYTNLAKSRIDNTEQIADYLDKISQSSEHLLSLINDVLDMSRIESGKVSLNENPDNLSDIIGGLKDMVRADLQAKGHNLDVYISNVNDENILCDRLRLTQVLLNILSNSIKYTPAGGNIMLNVRETGVKPSGYASYEFEISDNGMGMDEEYLKTIFDPFSRAKTTTVSGIEGTGLGMAITKNIVDMMGGKIEVVSRISEGTRMIVSLEFKLQKPSEVNKDALHAAGIKTVTLCSPLVGKKVLLVEDNELNVEISRLLLEDIGMTVTLAEDGDIAVDMMSSSADGDYDLILMDIQMPRMDGYEATKRIRSMEGAKSSIPIIAMTANAFEEDRLAAMESGMNEHIAKPIDIDNMISVLKKFF